MRRRMMLLAAGTALLAVVLLAVPLGIVAGHGYLKDERLELQQAAATAAAGARGDVLTTPQPSIDSSEIALSVYDRTGHLVSGGGPGTAGTEVRAALAGRQASTTSRDAMAVAAPVSDGDQVVAALLLTTNLDAVHQRTLHAWLALGGMGVGAVLLALLAARVLAGRLTSPLDRLGLVARRVGDGDLAARARPSGVPEVDALASALNDSVGRLEVMINRERAFSTEVSHQLRTPLSGLRLELEAAEQAVADGDHPPGRALRGALDAVDRLQATIADLIGLARDLPARERVALTELLDAATDRWHGVLAAASRPLRVHSDSVLPQHLDLSPAAGNQILDVLLDNAHRHGRGAVSIRVRDTGGDAVAVEVSDEGPALRVEAWQLFGGTAMNPATAEGERHGLGLPYARRLAEAEGARLVLAASEPPTFAIVVSRSAEDPLGPT